MNNNVWLPYTQMAYKQDLLDIKSASGVYLELKNERKLIDGISSWWSVAHGYNHHHIIKEIQKQLVLLPHVMFAGIKNDQAYRLCQRLAGITKMDKIFLSDSGSIAIEVAMKIAVQYWFNLGYKGKNKFVAFKNGYHGDSMGAMSLANSKNGMHEKFKGYGPTQFIRKIPSNQQEFHEFEEFLLRNRDKIAGLVIEPLLQAAGGMKIYSYSTMVEIYKICRKLNVIFILDECATGFYRTGEMFAYQTKSEAENVLPDILCIAKALTGGYISLAATIVNDKIFNAFLDEGEGGLIKALMHGPTFMGNPLACSAANASLDLFENEDYKEKVGKIHEILVMELEKCKKFNIVKDVRVIGAVGVVQIQNSTWKLMFELRKKFVEYGIWLRPFGDVIYTMPPLTISKEELVKITDSIYNILCSLE